jgi:hypothetical protein
MRSQLGVGHSLEQVICSCLPQAQIVERIERHPDAARLDLKIALVCLRRFDPMPSLGRQKLAARHRIPI